MRRRINSLTITLIIGALFLCAGNVNAQVIVDSKLTQKLKQGRPTELVSVKVTYKTAPQAADIGTLRSIGIQYGVVMNQLPMVGLWATRDQINRITALSNIRSIYFNNPLQFYN